jgi:hypothetical protein
MTEPPAVQQLGAAVLVQGAVLRDLYILLLKGIPELTACGHSPSRLHVLKSQVGRALMSARGQSVAKAPAVQQDSRSTAVTDLMSVADAATEMEVSERTMRRLAATHQLGVRFGSSWALRRADVLSLKAERLKGR